MRIIQDLKPRYKVQGIKSLKGVGFSSEEEALHYARVHLLMEILWKANINKNVPNPWFEAAEAIVKAFEGNGPTSSELKKMITHD